MSEMVHIVGKLVKVPIIGTVESTALSILTAHNISREYFYETALEQLLESDNKFYMRDGILYRVETTHKDHECDVFNAHQNPDGTIDFELVYYNGGCCLPEALTLALNKIGKSNLP